MSDYLENYNDDEIHFLSLAKAGQVLVSELLYPGSINKASLDEKISSRKLISSSRIPCPYINGDDHLSSLKRDTEMFMEAIPCIAIDIADTEAIRLEAPEIADDIEPDSIGSYKSLINQFYLSKHILEPGSKKKYKVQTYEKDKMFISFFTGEILKENRGILEKLTDALSKAGELTKEQIASAIKGEGFKYTAAQAFVNMMEYYSSNPHDFHKVRDSILCAQVMES